MVVPAHNEEAKIAEVLADLNVYGYKDILVVDDGSSDRTGEIAKKSGAKVVRHILNRGLGAALGTGFEFAKRHNFDCLITFDGDGQHKARDLAKLLRPIKSGGADVVIGSRFLGHGNTPTDRLIVNRLSNLVTFFLYRVWATDTLSGLRAFDRQAIEKITIKTDRMEVSNEFFMEIKRNNLKLTEVSIKPVYTTYSQKHSHNVMSVANLTSIGKGMFLRLFR